jgi:enamine deaminase RidA (YjgF/YER057c/UK114 family)
MIRSKAWETAILRLFSALFYVEQFALNHHGLSDAAKSTTPLNSMSTEKNHNPQKIFNRSGPPFVIAVVRPATPLRFGTCGGHSREISRRGRLRLTASQKGVNSACPRLRTHERCNDPPGHHALEWGAGQTSRSTQRTIEINPETLLTPETRKRLLRFDPMKKQTTFAALALLGTILLFSPAAGQTVATNPEAKLKELGIKLKTPAPPSANFIGAVKVGNLVFLSGQGPVKEDGTYMIGKVGKEFTLEEAKYAARLTGISLLESLKAEVGDLNKVKRIVKVLGMVNAVPEFDKHSQVINGFSDLMVEIFGENGRHARSAVGMGSLPRNIPVEIEMIVELKN